MKKSISGESSHTHCNEEREKMFVDQSQLGVFTNERNYHDSQKGHETDDEYHYKSISIGCEGGRGRQTSCLQICKLL